MYYVPMNLIGSNLSCTDNCFQLKNRVFLVCLKNNIFPVKILNFNMFVAKSQIYAVFVAKSQIYDIFVTICREKVKNEEDENF